MDFFSKYRPSIIALCEKHKVKRLFAFGSVLTSRFTEKSDIDLVVDFDKEVEQVEGIRRIRFMTSHPKDATQKLFETMARCGKVAPVLHLPFQAGNDRVLKAMNRSYTSGQNLELVD